MATASVTEPRTFWSLGGKYTIDPKTSSQEMANDVGCLLMTARAAVDAVIEACNNTDGQLYANPKDMANLLYGAIFHMEMVDNLVGAMKLADKEA